MHLVLLDFFIFFFNDHFLLFVLASVAANHKTATEADVLNKILLKYAPDKIGAGGRARTANNNEWDWICSTYLKNSNVRTPSPICTYSVQKVYTPFWFEIITISDIKRKINFINQVLLLQNPYILMKSIAYPPLI